MPPAAGGDDVVGRVPVELLDDLERRRLGALGVERAQRDVGEVHARGFGDFAAAAVGFVVVALHLADLRAERHARARLRVLEAVGVEDVGVDPRLGGERGDGGADVAGRDAADLGLAALEQPRDRHRDDAVLVGEARAVAGVVLQVQVAEARARRRAGRRGSAACSRSAGPRAPARSASTIGSSSSKCQMFCGRSELGTSWKWLRGELVVVDDVEALAAVRAGEDGVARAGSCARSGGRRAPVAHERVRCLDPC